MTLRDSWELSLDEGDPIAGAGGSVEIYWRKVISGNLLVQSSAMLLQLQVPPLLDPCWTFLKGGQFFKSEKVKTLKWDQDDFRCDADATCDPGQHQRVPGRDHRVRLQDIFGNSSPQVAPQTKVRHRWPSIVPMALAKRNAFSRANNHIFWSVDIGSRGLTTPAVGWSW